MSSLFSVSDRRVAVITGSTDGIGKAAAQRLVARGWSVVVVGRSPERANAVVEGLRAEVSGASVAALCADLSSMAEVARLAGAVTGGVGRLDLLPLNANTITQERRLTPEGFEANLAVGYLGRALLAGALAPMMQATPRSQVLSVVGMDHSPLDLRDPHQVEGFTARKALTRWQWAAQVWVREANRRGLPTANLFMPGLVRTKILAHEPQPMRLFVQIANKIMGISVEQSAEEVEAAVEAVAAEGLRDVWFARRARKALPLQALPAEAGQSLWSWTEQTLAPFRL